ncbi:MAG: exodeoxyribonuclease III [Clostridia bacterium]|nr:exodeoxyribonuclease III [Clostridia bacterium]
MKLVSWNVAGFRACLKKGFEDFFSSNNADVYCLQEVKAEKEEIPFNPEGYHFYLNTADKKGYSGTAIYSKKEPISVTYGMGIDEHDHEGRIITVEYEDFYLVNEYVPNVKRDLSRLDYRMVWEEDFKKYLKKLEEKKPVIVCGDFNVAHEEIDIKNAKANRGNAGFTDEERDKFTKLLESGFVDTFRYYNPDKKDMYSWWSYMGKAREKNVGWRIDYFITSKSIIDKVKNPEIYMDVFGSDHCPIGIDIDLK